jgi:uncharacterized membrane protein
VHYLYLLSVWLHILAAAVWIGGMIFLTLVLVPVTRMPGHRDIAPSLIHHTGIHFRRVGWVSLGLLVASGAFNLAYRGLGWADLWGGRLWEGPFGRTLGVKLLLVAAILLMSTLHDFFLGPKATTLWRENPDSPEAIWSRRWASWVGRINLLLGLAAVALGVSLVRGGP